MQTQLIQTGTRPADQAPPSKDNRPSSSDFAAVLGSLFAVVPAGQAPPTAHEAGPSGRPDSVSTGRETTKERPVTADAGNRSDATQSVSRKSASKQDASSQGDRPSA